MGRFVHFRSLKRPRLTSSWDAPALAGLRTRLAEGSWPAWELRLVSRPSRKALAAADYDLDATPQYVPTGGVIRDTLSSELQAVVSGASKSLALAGSACFSIGAASSDSQ